MCACMRDARTVYNGEPGTDLILQRKRLENRALRNTKNCTTYLSHSPRLSPREFHAIKHDPTAPQESPSSKSLQHVKKTKTKTKTKKQTNKKKKLTISSVDVKM